MAKRKFHLTLRRHIKLSREQVEDLSTQAGEHIEKNFVRRLYRLANVRRFVGTWILLVLLLIGAVLAQLRDLSGYYQTLQPSAGGVYNEGILGDFNNANPVYATGSVDKAVSSLVFSPLFTYNDQNQLVPDVATGWQVNTQGTTYTIHIRKNLKWQDGTPLTSADVLFTYQVIQSPDAQSPLESSFQGITVSAPDPDTVVFTLPVPLASFPYSLTTGIIPLHVLNNVPMDGMRSTTFNNLDPLGSGPFKFNAIEVKGTTPQTREEDIELSPFAGYWQGQPKLSEFLIRAFHDQNNMIGSFEKGELTAVSGLDSVPTKISNNQSYQTDNFALTAANMVFFRVSAGVLADVNVRRALIEGADQSSIIGSLNYPTIAVREPLLFGQLAYDPSLTQASFNPTLAKQVLTADGWVQSGFGIRYKNGQPLRFNLTASNDPEFTSIANQLQSQWKKIGVDLQLTLLDQTDLQNSLNYHTYDAILYGIAIGVDPDVFVYWDSSQADPRSPSRLNLSEYKSTTADDSLEGGRTRIDPVLRVIKYRPFLQAWQDDAPALGLYQPRFLYITKGPVYGLNVHMLNNGTDRFDNVVNWEIRQTKVTD